MFESELNVDLSPTMGYRLYDVCAIVFANCCKKYGTQAYGILIYFVTLHAENKLKTNYETDFIDGRHRAGKRDDNEWSKKDSS